MQTIHGAFLPYLEIHLADGCNLNCIACSHFSPLCSQFPLPDKDSILADIRRIRELFQGIGHLRLLGGEPLMNPDLPVILEDVRSILPDIRCSLVTNGLLLAQWGDLLMDTLKRTKITLCITGYPCNQQIGRQMEAKYRENGNQVVLTPQTDYFRLFLNAKGRRPGEHCELHRCTLLREGRLYRCSLTAMIFAYNRAFAKSYPEEPGIDIYTISDGFKAIKLLQNQGELCMYCSDCGILRKWGCNLQHTAGEWCADSDL